MIFLFIFFILLSCCLAIFLFFLVISIFTGAPYLGIVPESLDQIIAFANIKRGKKTLDLGSGDGRIVIAMAKKGAIAHGYEINPFYVLLSKIKFIKREFLKMHLYIGKIFGMKTSPSLMLLRFMEFRIL